jgi:AraC-like DNA-binding protein
MVECQESAPCFTFDSASYPDGGRYGPLKKQYVTLLVVQEGQALVNFDGGSDELSANHCALYVNRQFLSIVCPAGVPTRLAFCSLLQARSLSSINSEDIQLVSPIKTSDHIQTLIRFGLELGLAEAPSIARLRNAIGEALVSAYAADGGFRSRTIIPDIVLQARDYADRHFSEDCDLARLAESVGVSREYLVSTFRKHLGITPVRYLWALRTKKAVQLVRETNLNLIQIADKCGYKSQFHLSREIKRMTGLCPRDLRQRRRIPALSEVSGYELSLRL